MVLNLMKTDFIKVRLTEQEKILLQEKATAMEMSMSDYVKYCCLIDPPKPKEKNLSKK